MTEQHAASRQQQPEAEPSPVVVVLGLVAAPGAPADVAASLSGELTQALAARHPDVTWDVRPVVDGLVQPPFDDDELVDAARRRLLTEDWDLVLCLTDVPLEVSRRPVVGHASPVHGVAVLSVPALGAVGRGRRALEAATGLVHTLLGDDDGDDPDDRALVGRRLRELATDPSDTTEGVRFTARVLTGNLRLLVGMVRANRPWRLAARLTRALTAAIAAGVFALITPDIWRLADNFGWLRLTVVAVGSVVATAATLVVGAELWERPHSRRVRKQVTLFNLATGATVLIGVLTLYAVLFLLALAGSLLLVVPALFTGGLGHAAGVSDYLELAWLISSLATVGGALGAGLESDDAVRQAAYSYRPDRGPTAE
ncbi:hypothetical protein [Blastococcus haudaquaticus]|uniref:Uncharacterized protein n=1 Tax=Blastococcus haudaquaticus TaxID=1938745 RepID=A0A286H0S1_9ACTN|nr:hypothetical protein [Blastococcus haudaquaticus]SOE01390.1 hypothetical protein SAMN06272739_3138 [Blastococcus haudaquaticus]